MADDVAEIEPTLRQAVTHEIDTPCSAHHVVVPLVLTAGQAGESRPLV